MQHLQGILCLVSMQGFHVQIAPASKMFCAAARIKVSFSIACYQASAATVLASCKSRVMRSEQERSVVLQEGAMSARLPWAALLEMSAQE